MRLTDHFSLDELIQSQIAARHGIDNTPSAAIIKNLTVLATTLERVRTLLGSRPILISSGYRSESLNRIIGGAITSAHVKGLAADFICPGYGAPRDVCQKIAAADIEFDQLIFEGAWVHLGLAAGGARPRRQILTAHFSPAGATTYTAGVA